MPPFFRQPFFIALCLLLVAVVCYQVTFQQLLQRSQQLSFKQGAEFNQYLNLQLTRFSTLTDTLAHRPELQDLLTAPDNAAKQQQVSQLLADFTLASGSASIYLMNQNGDVVASSNYAAEVNFMDHNFAFRPYFSESITANTSYIDYGLGWVSNERGIYFAATVSDAQQQTIGVLTTKMNIDQLELAYQSIAGQSPLLFMLVDDENTVLASNHEAWRLTWFGEDAVTRSRHPNTTLHALQVNQQQDIWQLRPEPVSRPLAAQQYVVAIQDQPTLPWQLVMLEPAAPLKMQAWQLAISFCLLLAVILLARVFWRNKSQQQQQKALMLSQLESAVAERTESLQQSNQQLQVEIQHRIDAEHELKQTQDQLLQAAKLATIGQLSASINHEINQPLTAMHSYLQNSQLLLKKGLYSELQENLDKMAQMILRLNHMVKQFKSFSRKAANQPVVVALSSVLQNALDILAPSLKQQSINITLLQSDHVKVKIDPLQLEQVLINVLGNAMQAAEQHAAPTVSIRIVQRAELALVQIHDNGSGIKPHVMAQLFEPFFTTKQGSGLGLGLSISRQIMQSYHGSLTIENHPDGGALVSLTLPRYLAE
ncbi:sensor histidine kinase [Rheinheimera sp. UJ63]|uniref:sensor histidine kinase n=1 Tax=Rheinheimera sp. UJ63 TaxID=2910157 RepID=UPI001F41F87C|nr:ATP-binding protein [Rheinheimera sp. UJ63]MCF4009891.1 ATP-binding protein [Rheinheimera sp. UJ63]